MNASARRVMSSILALFFLVLAGVVFFNLVTPLYADIQQVRAEQASRQVLLDNQKSVVEQVKQLIASSAEADALHALVSEALPPDPRVGRALLQFQGLASLHQLAVRSLAVSADRAPVSGVRGSLITPSQSVTIRADMTGTYEDFRAFLSNLETNVRIFDLKAMSIQPIAKQTNLFGFSLTVAAYYQP